MTGDPFASPFSHAPPTPEVSTPTPGSALRFEVRLPVPAADAWRGFTEGVYLWWPVGAAVDDGSGGSDAEPDDEIQVEFEGSELIAVSSADKVVTWARTIGWQAERWIELAFEPDAPVISDRAMVEFDDDDAGSAVTWTIERGVGAWDDVVGGYARFVGGTVLE